MKLVTTTDDLAKYFVSKSVAAPLAALKDTGFKHVDLSIYNVVYEGSPWIGRGEEWKKEIEECQSIADKCGFDFCQAHAPAGSFFRSAEEREWFINAVRHSIEACAMLGIPHIVLHAESLGHRLPTKLFGRRRFIEKNKELFCTFADDMERHGVDVLVENSSNLWNPGYFLNTGKDIRAFVKEANIPRLHVCWDTGHANCDGLDQYKEITAIGDQLRAFHMQDNYGNGDSHVMPMAGTINWDSVLRAMKDIGYKGDFTFEGSNTLRRSNCWPNFRRNVKEGDILSDPALHLQQKQLSVMYEVGKWMLASYGFEAE